MTDQETIKLKKRSLGLMLMTIADQAEIFRLAAEMRLRVADKIDAPSDKANEVTAAQVNAILALTLEMRRIAEVLVYKHLIE